MKTYIDKNLQHDVELSCNADLRTKIGPMSITWADEFQVGGGGRYIYTVEYTGIHTTPFQKFKVIVPPTGGVV